MEGGHLEDGGVDGGILKWILKKWDVGLNWIDVAQGRGSWRALLYAVMNLRVPKNAGILLNS